MGGAGPGVVGPALEVGRPLEARQALVGGGQAWEEESTMNFISFHTVKKNFFCNGLIL